MAELCEGLTVAEQRIADALGGPGLVRCPMLAEFEAEWTCAEGHSRKRLSCLRHMEAAAAREIGCAQCLAAGIDGVPITFSGAIRLPVRPAVSLPAASRLAADMSP